MIKKIIRRNKQKFTAIFKEGRTMFPRYEFNNVTYLGKANGMNLFRADEGFAYKGMTFCNEATWS
ncbi:hypothetical protein KNV09_gp176 [Vibrio phage Athena]|uniref:Uncharacterized protein n=6 Tax=Thalassavirus TaxID=2948922 RepID=A0A4Y6E9T9_9CAUD|nr:hypothetical protein KNU52_gp162 [Vibrio phage Achelous]YP_010102546.1 hypothetical protein KNU58_gp159 [Vibrio phage Brizo]YP_010108156.1 hypothetical protein KNV06_gp173 [Vibrio phage AG74]YP_010108346.1 hypothetical protein KNV07_gp176 [Vibrio phage Cody]YP_010108540.1 hypothetical protein KNV08_gp180 [Vibrio phage Quinn]YP_010108734.1 hypothetical protein KNV09_gp176 [Vibrio phage Athena]QIG66426.1 hypothetical protein CHAZLY21_133 [Vibrio phage Chazly21]QQO89947.1 hypothetical protei